MAKTDPMLLERARAMRSNMPQPERELWTALRGKRFERTKFTRQVVIGPYIADFVCRSRKLIIELDGATHADASRDADRTAHLERQGYRVIRFWNNDVMTNLEGVLAAIGEALASPLSQALSPWGRGLKMDHATSTAPAVQRQLDRLWALGPGADVLGLDRITRLLDRIGNPHRDLPPVLHVAGTNGKGSTCAFLRAAVEAAGLTAHVYSSPHLVRFNERIRLAGTLIDDPALAALLEEVLDAAEAQGDNIGASFFEVTTAAAFLAFHRTPADACIVEVGLGGRLDATNVIPAPAACAIAQLGIDHQAFLGDTAEAIAGEKAGIAKAGVPLVTMNYDASVATRVAEVAAAVGAPIFARGEAWDFTVSNDRLHYRDRNGELETPLPFLAGPHQPANLALAIATLRHQRRITVPEAALSTAAAARWPARMQRLGHGSLTTLLPAGAEVWLDGGHNEAAARSVSAALASVAQGRAVHLILGMLSNKDATGLLAPFAPLAASLTAVPVPHHAHHDPADLAATAQRIGIADARTATTVRDALTAVAHRTHEGEPLVMILGSLYLAGEVLAQNDETPD